MSSRGSSRVNDDWVCSDSQCANLNFARRLYCNRCGRDKDSLPSKRPSTEIGKAAAERSRGLFSADDWQCAKCGNVNWARRVQCNVCNAPRVGDVEERTGYGGGYNERENVEYIDREESDGEYDEFGRKKKKYRDPALMPKPKIKEPEVKAVVVEEEEDEEEEEDGDLSKYKLESEEEDEDGDISKYDLGSSDEDPPKNDKRPHLSSHSSRSSKKSSSSSRSRSRSDSPPAKKKRRLSSGHSRSRSRSSSQDSRSPARKRSQSGSSKSNRSGSGSPDSSSNKSRERSGSDSRSRPRH